METWVKGLVVYFSMPDNVDDSTATINGEVLGNNQYMAQVIREATIENFDQYDTVFVGYPIWWGDMPMILYTFFDSYDFSGKTLIPFGTHGGSGWAGTPAKIAQLEPNATILDGLSISRNVIEDTHDQIVEWAQKLDI